MKECIKVKVNNAALAKFLEVALDTVIHVPSKNGIPLNREWRNRLRDAEIDKCVSVIKPVSSSPSKKGDK